MSPPSPAARFAPLVKLRKREEDRAREKLLACRQQRAQAEARVAELEAQLRASDGGGCRAAEWDAREWARARLRAERDGARAALAEAKAHEEAARKDLEAAHRRRKVLERLSEARQEEWSRERERLERLQLDELAGRMRHFGTRAAQAHPRSAGGSDAGTRGTHGTQARQPAAAKRA